MIPTEFLEIIILILMVYIFQGKVIPQIIIAFLAIYMGSIILIEESNYMYAVFFAVIVLYSMLTIFTESDSNEN